MWKRVVILVVIITLFSCTKAIKPEAVAEYEKGMEIVKEYSYYSYYNFEERSKAFDYFHRAIEIDSTFADAYYQLGILYDNSSTFTPKYLNKTIEIDSTHIEAHKKLAKYYEYIFDNKKAKYHVIRAAQLGDKDMQEWCDKEGLKWRDE